MIRINTASRIDSITDRFPDCSVGAPTYRCDAPVARQARWAERRATHTIILMVWPIGIDPMFEQAGKDPHRSSDAGGQRGGAEASVQKINRIVPQEVSP